MRSCYIAGPYTGQLNKFGVVDRLDEDINIYNAAKVAFEYYLKGYAVYCPHLQTSYIDRNFNDGELDYEDWLAQDIYWINKCDVVVFLPGWKESRGAVIEHMVARGLGKEIHYWEASGHD